MWDLWAKKSYLPKICTNNTMDYPQAYPILMSITYVLIGSLEIEFSRTISLIYPIMIWVIMIRILVLFPKYNKEIKITLFFIAVLTLNQFRHFIFWVLLIHFLCLRLFPWIYFDVRLFV